MKRFYLLSVISLFSAGISAQEITGGERTLSADSIYGAQNETYIED
ncbi:hypothetical protein [Bacteroides stercoris]|nr:hypothetical protein [Bacteroides stercoris]